LTILPVTWDPGANVAQAFPSRKRRDDGDHDAGVDGDDHPVRATSTTDLAPAAAAGRRAAPTPRPLVAARRSSKSAKLIFLNTPSDEKDVGTDFTGRSRPDRQGDLPPFVELVIFTGTRSPTDMSGAHDAAMRELCPNRR
jgi:hypothetical protein